VSINGGSLEWFGNAKITNIEPMHRIRKTRFSPARLGIPAEPRRP
jgi:hypothetical protein